MQLVEERPDLEYILRGADGTSALVNERKLQSSFIIAPTRLVEDWPVRNLDELTPATLEALLALAPEVILLGTGERQGFPHAAVAAACLRQGIGIEAMTNAAAARTYNVLAGEGRRVVAGFLLPG